jgi:transcriptional repressor NrdR
MTLIKKRDGRMETFMPEKIVVSVVKSGAPLEEARMIAKDIEMKAGSYPSTQEIKVKVLSMLRQKNPEWEKNWLMYDRAVKKRRD